MKARKTLSTIIILFIGIVIGFAIALLIGAVVYYLDSDTLLTDHPKTFGDIEIWALKHENHEEDEKPYKTLIMKKNKTPFFYAAQNKDGKVTEIAIVGENKSIRLTIKTSKEPGKWEEAIYGCTKDYITGEQYIDINFDGQFETKYIFDNIGELISRHIYIDGIWKEIESFKNRVAISGQTKYVFDPNSGWQKE